MREAFAMQKLLIFFQQKILAYLKKLTSENLTKRLLMTSLVLNNRAMLSLMVLDISLLQVQPMRRKRKDVMYIVNR